MYHPALYLIRLGERIGFTCGGMIHKKEKGMNVFSKLVSRRHIQEWCKSLIVIGQKGEMVRDMSWDASEGKRKCPASEQDHVHRCLDQSSRNRCGAVRCDSGVIVEVICRLEDRRGTCVDLWKCRRLLPTLLTPPVQMPSLRNAVKFLLISLKLIAGTKGRQTRGACKILSRGRWCPVLPFRIVCVAMFCRLSSCW